MADKEFESDDPMELVGMVCAESDDGALDEMGHTFVEEFIRMGWPRDSIIGLFLDPFYRGPHALLRSKGLGYVMALVDAAYARRQPS